MTTSDSEVVLCVDNLVKDYRTGFRMKRTRAVHGVSFEVKRGEVFGFVGPNGAGKTTTIRALMGLIRPTSGSCSLFGVKVPNREARKRLGFLPESPYFYEYLTGREIVDLAGRLFGLSAKVRRERAEMLLAKVGIAHAADKPVRKYSKGMLQRAGLAQALVNDPELVVLDEPMSGLDPLGRKEVRDIILELRDAGKTVFFSSHILHDIETVCDRAAIITQGQVRDVGTLRNLVNANLAGREVVLLCTNADTSLDDILPADAKQRRMDREVRITLAPHVAINDMLSKLSQRGEIVSVSPLRESLEDVFVRHTQSSKGEFMGEEAR